MFLQNGFDGTTLEAVTAAAGIAKRTVYLRYGDKKTLFQAAVKRAIDQWIVPIESLRAVETDDLHETLLAVGKVLVDNMLSSAGLQLLRITNAESGSMPDMGEYFIHEGSDRTIEYLADLFCRHLGKDDDEFAEAFDAAEAFLHLVVGGPANQSAWGMVKDKEAIDRRVVYSVGLFLSGLRARSRCEAPVATVAELQGKVRQLTQLIANASGQLKEIQASFESGVIETEVRTVKRQT
jgi:AcrR family transcriptional regulator